LNIPGIIKNFTAETAIGQYRAVAFGSTDGSVVQGAAVTDLLIGVCAQPAGGAIGERVDVVMDGITEIEYGGTVTRGALLTTDSLGRAVVAAPASGVVNNLIGRAAESGVLGTIGSVILLQTQIKG